MAVIMPSDHGGLFNGDERYLNYLSRDIVGHIDHEFRTFGDSRHRGLDGLSTGGFTSTMLAAVRHDVWGSIGSMSGCHDDRTFATIRGYAGAMRWAGQRHRLSCATGEARSQPASPGLTGTTTNPLADARGSGIDPRVE